MPKKKVKINYGLTKEDRKKINAALKRLGEPIHTPNFQIKKFKTTYIYE